MGFFGRIFSKKDPDESVSVDEEPKKRGFKSYLIIGLVLVIIIAAIAVPKILNKPASATEPSYTLSDARGNITALAGNYSIFAGQYDVTVGQVAKHTTDISNINSRINGITFTDWQPIIASIQNTQQSLQQSVSVLSGNVTALVANILSGNTTVGNSTFNYTALNSTVNNLASQLSSFNAKLTELATNQTVNSDELWDVCEVLNATASNLTAEIHGLTFTTLNYVQVTDVQPGLDSNIAWITIHGSGSFPVIVTFYGDNLTDTATNVFSPGPSCTLAEQYLYGDSILSAVITPVSGWSDNRVVMVTVTKGLIDYATAVIGGS